MTHLQAPLLNRVIMQIQYGPLYVCFVLFYTEKKRIVGASIAHRAPTGPQIQPWVVFGERMSGESSGLKQLAATRPLFYVRFFFCAATRQHPHKPLARPPQEGERWGEIG